MHLPEEIIEECAAHAARAHRTYKYHGDDLFALSPEIVDTHVRNVFVRGYYYKYGHTPARQRRTFESYLENYYASQEPVRFLREIAETCFDKEVRVATIDSLAPGTRDEELAQRAREVMLGLIENAPFVDTRTPEEKQRLAETDARLLLTLCSMNSDRLQDETKRLLWARCYVLTNSSRYQKAAREMHVVNVATTRPQQVATVYELLRGPVIDDVMFVQLFDNPILNAVVDAMWPELEKIAKSGIELRDKSLVRLRRDVDVTFHDALSRAEEAESTADRIGDEGAEAEAGNRYIALLDEAEGLGYQLNPIASKLQQISKAGAEKDKRIAELESQYREIDERISHFGRRKQRYLRRMAAKRPE